MPIEIKELHIKATIVDKKQNASSQQISLQDKERLCNEIVKVCVNEVLQILEDKRER